MGRHRVSKPTRPGEMVAKAPDERAGKRTKASTAWIRSRRLRRAGLWALRVALVAFFLGALVLFTLVEAMPLPTAPVYAASTVYGRDDEVAARLYLEDRTPVPIESLPQHLLDAVVAIEDYRFERHAGVDFLGILRAAYSNLLRLTVQPGRTYQGASTITQQLATALYLTRERTYTRKIKEAVLALKLERRMTKTEILEGYLNQVYFGHGAYGVEVASQIYFGKPASQVNLAEAAMLAGVLRSPESYTPYRDATLARNRRSFVLTRMVELGYITQAQASEAKDAELRLVGLKPRVQEAPYFVDYMLAEIAATHPEVARDAYQGGYQIYSTLDLPMQRAANQSVKTQMVEGEKDANGVTQPQIGLAAVDPQTGHILAMVGGRDYRETQLNRATQAFRQPGSAFKPFLYAALVDRGYTTISQMVCEPVTYPAGPGQPDYTPRDYGSDRYHYAPLTMRYAIKISDNVVAVRWAYEVGTPAVINMARKMGLYSPLSPVLPLVLGSFEVYPLELATAYAPLANGGSRVEAYSVRKIVDSDGRVIYERAPRVEPAISPSTAFIVTNMLQSVMEAGGTGGHLGWRIGRPSAGKTGTTSDTKDAWFVGFVPQVVCAVYVGADDPATLAGPGGRLAGPVWAEFMRLGLAGVPVAGFPRPPDVVDVAVCTETWLRANATCPSINEVFREGTEPQTECPLFHGWPFPPDGGDEDEGDEPERPTGGYLYPADLVPGSEEWWEAYELWLRYGSEWPEGP